mmetsp:Transcript_18486/g.59614  ORF Transcript_18486/g.59614 Transcript_18486/m.59614 type:complete len:216 (-) Transcript_18486:2259-2906(-)
MEALRPGGSSVHPLHVADTTVRRRNRASAVVGGDRLGAAHGGVRQGPENHLDDGESPERQVEECAIRRARLHRPLHAALLQGPPPNPRRGPGLRRRRRFEVRHSPRAPLRRRGQAPVVLGRRLSLAPDRRRRRTNLQGLRYALRRRHRPPPPARPPRGSPRRPLRRPAAAPARRNNNNGNGGEEIFEEGGGHHKSSPKEEDDDDAISKAKFDVEA